MVGGTPVPAHCFPSRTNDECDRLVDELIRNNQTKEQKDMPCSLCGQKYANKGKLRHWREFRCSKLKVKAISQRSQPEAGDAAAADVTRNTEGAILHLDNSLGVASEALLE
jgi:hypothetical protein